MKVRRSWIRLAYGASALALVALGHPGTSLAGDQSAEGLVIGNDSKTGRPNVFIAWRNTNRILEVEIEVKNYLDRQAGGELRLEILDLYGNILDRSPKAHQEAIDVVLPARALGGAEGRIVQMHGTKELNLLIDRLDRANERYSMRAEFVPNDGSSVGLHNVVAKSFNSPSRARPNASHFYEYFFRNNSPKPVDVIWKVSHAGLPDGWALETNISSGQSVTLPPNATVQGVATILTPPDMREGDRADVRFGAINAQTGEVVGVSEWFLVADTRSPEITEVKLAQEDGVLSVTATAVDDDSMLKEASGVRLEYSTDGGTTFSNRVMAYADGNFVGPTRFLADLGPFQDDAVVEMALIVEDIAGNKATLSFDPVEIGNQSVILR